MKRTIAQLLAGAMLIAALGLPATASEEPTEQAVAGSVAAPVPSNVSGGPRRAFLASRATNGVIGYAFDVEPTTIGGPFDLTVTDDPTGEGDLNIIFYSDPGNAADGAPTAAAEYLGATVGGERGIVPDEATIAMVFISTGANVSFGYKATPPPVVALADAAPLDVTARSGGVVRFVNNTEAVAFVRHTPATGKVMFTSDPAGIAPGATFDVYPPGAGSYPYATSVGNGTITVAD